jgi:ATP-binding cassette subfamily F protein 3
VLIGLAFPEDTWQHNAKELSGGQKTRLMLAAALVKAPDFLFLMNLPTIWISR